MSLLQKAVVEQSAAKVAAFGPGGSGKSLTLTLLAIALSKTFHKGAPIAMFETEGASDWLIDIYAAEGVDLLRVKSKAFKDMRQALREGQEAGCCGFIADSYSHPWAELQSSLKKKLNVNKLEFHHMQELQELWSEWVDQFLNSPLHCFFAGRLAFEWENDVDVETGKMGFHKAGTKMRAEKDAGYEPHLLLEMEAQRVMEEIRETKAGNRRKKTRVERKAGGHFLHRVHVLKDRARILNGRMFEFKDINNYQAGDWKTVYQALAPHFAKMHIGGATNHAVDSTRSSAALFDGRGDAAYARRVKRVQIVLEEIDGTLVKLWPEQTAKAKAMKALAIETTFNTRSWTAVEQLPLEILDLKLDALKLAEDRIQDGEQGALTEAPALLALLGSCLQETKAAAEQAEQTVGIL